MKWWSVSMPALILGVFPYRDLSGRRLATDGDALRAPLHVRRWRRAEVVEVVGDEPEKEALEAIPFYPDALGYAELLPKVHRVSRLPERSLLKRKIPDPGYVRRVEQEPPAVDEGEQEASPWHFPVTRAGKRRPHQPPRMDRR